MSLANIGATDLAKRGILDPANYKTTTTSRGITYNYFFSPPANTGKRFLVFLHGWLGLSYDYRFQIDFFKEAGYGLVVPDMLGYGNTDKPTDPEVYKSSLISRDIVDLLDAESIDNNVVVIGHDWGSKIATRLANYFPERFSAFGFLAVGNIPGAYFKTPYSEINKTHKTVHINYLGHLDSLLSLIHTADPVELMVHFAPLGALEAWVKGDQKSASTIWTPEEESYYRKAYSAPGAVEASLAWYKVAVSGIEGKDSESIPPESIIVTKPVFFGVDLKDFVVLAAPMIQSTLSTSAKPTIHLYDTAHWVQWEAKDEVNRDLLSWIERLE
ncbi:hypothetical protein PQX77_012439 [Marasmius sp. AFHP31]|nr:hypothetical protein PQX77_012439 [Marasmius sp. AFHP31]